MTARFARSPSDADNRRRFPRTRVLLAGRVYRGGQGADCIVTDLSAGGARLKLRRPLEGDGPAALMIYRYGAFPGEVMWRSDGGAGIRFLDAPPVVAAALRPTLAAGASAV